jgi:hypothetical protein
MTRPATVVGPASLWIAVALPLELASDITFLLNKTFIDWCEAADRRLAKE